MTPTQLREWSFQNSQPDQWWLCLDAVMVEVPVTVAEIKSFLESGDYSRGRVLHISQADMAYPPWVDVTMPQSMNAAPDMESSMPALVISEGGQSISTNDRLSTVNEAEANHSSKLVLLTLFIVILFVVFKFFAWVGNLPARFRSDDVPVQQVDDVPDLSASDEEKNSDNNKWYVGGTLSSGGATMDQWRRASYEDRLASTADFIARMLGGNMGNLSMDGDIKPMATRLEREISSAYGKGVTDTMPVTEIAAAIIIILKEKGVRGFTP